ncbi:3954_t:CDS:2 [Paraglomus occultum]|uniref:3954_t:CDS:1 n=1 Tax=Paraglomus occultum TaxID=144539 RepID=A0A9N9B9F9_9GLOM|nr:3954_t:CDS:2 [Paraglomus occultum]
MSLGDFLTDPSTGSWADEMEGLPSAPAAAYSDQGDHDDRRGGYGDKRSFSGGRNYSRDSRYDSRDSPRDARFTSRSERVPPTLPTAPPYTAHLGNLPFDLDEHDIHDFFRGSKIATVRILRDRDRDDRSKGFGYVEFQDLQSLAGALELNNETLRGRPIRVSVADPPREREPREDRTAGEWRRAMPRDSPVSSPRNDRFSNSDRFGHRDGRWSERGSFRDRGIDRPGDRNDRFERGGFDRPDQGDRGNTDRSDGSKTDTQWRGGGFGNKPGMVRERRVEDRHGPSSMSPPPMRKKLELKPRTVDVSPSPPEVAPTTPRNRPNPFGEAKPIDNDEALRRVEERRRQKEREREDKEDKEEREDKEKPEALPVADEADTEDAVDTVDTAVDENGEA